MQAIEARWRAGHRKFTDAEADALLDARPEMPDTDGATPACQLLYALLNPFKGDRMRHELTRRKFYRVRRDFAGPSPTPTETLLAERAALCWLDLQVTHLGAARLEGENLNAATFLYMQKRVDAAQRRFESAVKTLAVVRKLGVPDLKVNIDQRSVTIANPAPPAIDVGAG